MNILFKISRTRIMIFIIIFQVLILMGEYLNSVYPLWTGKEVLLRVRPIDPRSLFRGNYALLNYDIATLDRSLISKGNMGKMNKGAVVYISLERDGRIWNAQSVSWEKPGEGLFIRGRITTHHRSSGVRIKYGIEALFAPEKKAKEIEQLIRRRSADKKGPVVAEVMIAPNGKPALVGVKAL